MTIYADSSFFVSHYLQDGHSSEVRRRMAQFPSVWFTQFHRIEFIHAVYQHVFRGYVSSSEATKVLEHLENDCESGIWELAEFPAQTFAVGELLAHRHVARLGVRTLDSLHVAAALELGADRFWTFDLRQARLAEAEGLVTS